MEVHKDLDLSHNLMVAAILVLVLAEVEEAKGLESVVEPVGVQAQVKVEGQV